MAKIKSQTELLSLAPSRVHEVSGPAAASFAFMMMRKGETVICGPERWLSSLHPEAVERFCDPNALLHVPCPLDADALWAAESALRTSSVANVILVTEKSPGLTNFRRLQLAALAGKTLGLVITNRPASSTAAETRWYCAPAPAKGNDSTPIHASLYKNKKGTIGSWIVNVNGEKDRLYLDATPAGEPVWPGRDAG